MKSVLKILILMFVFNVTNLNAQKSIIKHFKCSFIGKEKDIKHFLVIEDSKGGDKVTLERYGKTYEFLVGDDYVKTYVSNSEENILETQRFPYISTSLDTDRRYRMKIIYLDDGGFKILLKRRRNKKFTRLKAKKLIIECTKEKK